MKKLYPTALATLALTTVLAGCMHLPPVNVGDPLQLDGTTVSMVSLDHLALGLELTSQQEDRPPFRWIDEAIPDPTTFVTMNDLIAQLLQSRPPLEETLPPQLPDLRPPGFPAATPPELMDALFRSYMRIDEGRTLPPAPPEDPRAAMDRLQQELQRRLIEERERLQQDVARRRQEQIDRAAEAQRRIMEAALNRKRLDPTAELRLPVPIFIEGGTLDLDVPDIARYLANGFRQELSIAQLELTAPDGVTLPGYPDRLEVRGLSISLLAHTQEPAGGAVRPLIMFQHAVLQPDDAPIVFEHAGGGRYEPGNEVLFPLHLDSNTTRRLFDAINNGLHIAGNADIAISLYPALSSQVSVNFTLRAGDAFIRP